MTLTDSRTPTAGGPPDRQRGVAQELADVVTPLFGGALPVRIRAWDGSEAGPADAPAVVVNDAGRPAPAGVPARRARPGPGLRHRRDRRRGRPARRLPPGLAARSASSGASPELSPATVLAGLRTAKEPRRLRPPARARRRRRPGCAAGCTR